MRGKRLLIPSIIAVSLFVVIIIIDAGRNSNDLSRVRESEKAFSDINLSTIDSFTVTDKNGRTEITKRDGQWIIPALDGYPANKKVVNDLLLYVSRLQPYCLITENPKNHPYLGVGLPIAPSGEGRLVAFGSKGRELYRFVFGNYRKDSSGNTFESGEYIRRLPGNGVSLVGEQAIIPVRLLDWVDVRVLRPGDNDIKSVTIIHKSPDDSFTIVRGSADEPFVLRTSQKANAMEVQNLVSSIEGLNFEGVILSDSPQLKGVSFEEVAGIETFSGLTYKLSTGLLNNKTYLKVSLSSKDPLKFKEDNERLSRWTYQVQPNIFSTRKGDTLDSSSSALPVNTSTTNQKIPSKHKGPRKK